MSQQSNRYPSPYHIQKADEIWAKLEESGEIAASQVAETQELCGAVFGNSPFLASIAGRWPAFAAKALTQEPDILFNALIRDLQAPRPTEEKTESLMAFLRDQKSQVALLVAAADISRRWSLEDVTHALSQFADLSLELCLAHQLFLRMKAGDLPWPDGEEEPVSPSLSRNSGYFILGMGKLGALELNYSSDVDLIALYDPARTTYTGTKSLGACFIKITQETMQMMERRTMHGYVFRTDLRLRPDPGATPVAISVDAAVSYYHSMAVNWERSAMIKARVVAGDRAAGAEYLETMSRWVWRKNMDFNALRDIAAIKNQINRHYAQESANFPGYDVKLGLGGIREIEFFAQTNQLLHAGRHPRLRCRGTLNALENLANEQLIPPAVCNDLSSGYRFLRELEHRIQMINDEQTHSIPEDADSLERLALFMGYETPDELEAETRRHTTRISEIYDSLLPSEPDDRSSFNERQLNAELANLGYKEVDTCVQLVEGWRRGRYRALRSERAKTLLDQILPGLFEAFAQTSNPDTALTRFDKFISQLPAGVQLFSLLQSNPSLFKLLARVLGLAPALAETLAKKPDLWDAVLEPGFFAPLEDELELTSRLQALLKSAVDYQDMLDIVRRFVAEHKFRIGVQVLEAIADVKEAGASLTTLADVALKALLPHVEKQFAEKHGRFAAGGLAIVAMGKYGGGELTHTSDLDVVFLYHVDDMNSFSDGLKPLGPSQYFSRLGQHVITAITALTPEGRLYEVDTRLRPSGSQGPLVVTLKTFSDYYSTSAWAWEHMALTRARVVTAPSGILPALKNTIERVLVSPRDDTELLVAVADMRQKLFAEFGTENIWAIKHCRGGLVDMEFICQYLMLREGHKSPELFHPNLPESLARLRSYGILPNSDADALLDAHFYLQRVQSILRLCLGSSPANDDEIPYGLRRTLCKATQTSSFDELKQAIASKQSAVYRLFERMIEKPANQTAAK